MPASGNPSAAVLDSRTYGLLFDKNPIPMAVIDKKTYRFLAANAAALKRYGYSREELLAMKVMDLWPAEDFPANMKVLKSKANGSGPLVPVRHQAKDGSIILAEPTRCQVRFEGKPAVLVCAQDVTKSRRVEEELRRAQMFMEKAQEVVQMGTWISDPSLDGGLAWSKETHRIFGVKEGDFDGRVETFFSFVHPDDRAAVAAASTTATRRARPYRISHRIRRSDGSIRWVEEAAAVVRDAKGRATMMVGIVQDITDRVAAQERVQQSQRLEAVGRLAGGIAHDFNNYLYGIMCSASALAESMPGKDPRRKQAGDLIQAAQSASQLTRQLLAFSRRQVLEPQIVDPGAVLLDMKPLLERLAGKGVELQLSLRHRGMRILFDPSQLQQILLNLTINAADAMPRGGRLSIVLRQTAVSPGEAAPAPAGNYLELCASDTGTGMRPEVLSHIFEPFFTTKPRGKGTGLGLSTVYGIVKQSRGHIVAESEPGAGARFRIFLPPARGRRAA